MSVLDWIVLVPAVVALVIMAGAFVVFVCQMIAAILHWAAGRG